MGRHAADDDAGVHPLVAAVLEAREAPAHRLDRPAAVAPGSDGEGGLGWPGTPGDGTGLGWPGDTDAPGAPTAPPAATSGPKRSVWRRLLGLAEPDQGRSAA